VQKNNQKLKSLIRS